MTEMAEMSELPKGSFTLSDGNGNDKFIFQRECSRCGQQRQGQTYIYLDFACHCHCRLPCEHPHLTALNPFFAIAK